VISSVEVSNETDARLELERVREFAQAVLAGEGDVRGLALAFVEEPVMAELNERYRSLAEPTDVLSFSYAGVEGEDWPEPDDLEQEPFLGDVVICPAVASKNAADDGITLDLELRRLVIHGIMHLMGYDHESDQGQMRAREDAVLTAVTSLPGSLVED
jgi:probable rRNA maturation factor